MDIRYIKKLIVLVVILFFKIISGFSQTKGYEAEISGHWMYGKYSNKGTLYYSAATEGRDIGLMLTYTPSLNRVEYYLDKVSVKNVKEVYFRFDDMTSNYQVDFSVPSISPVIQLKPKDKNKLKQDLKKHTKVIFVIIYKNSAWEYELSLKGSSTAINYVYNNVN